MQYVQVFSDKTATTLKSTAIIKYTVHAILLSCFYSCRLCMIGNGHLLVWTLAGRREENREGRSGGTAQNASIYWFS